LKKQERFPDFSIKPGVIERARPTQTHRHFGFFAFDPCLGARVAPQQSPILQAGHEQDNTSEFVERCYG
jgi:hypothetical protein